MLVAHELNDIFHNDDSVYLDLATISLDSSGDAAVPVHETEPQLTHKKDVWNYVMQHIISNCFQMQQIIRGSIKFNNSQQMLHDIKHFEKFVNNNGKSCNHSIVKCTNNFSSLEQQNVFTSIDYKYWDIKFNVLIYDNDTNQAMIGEIQFVLS